MKTKYTLPENLSFMFKTAWATAKSILAYMLVHIPVIVFIPLMATYLSREVVALVTAGADVNALILSVGKFALCLAALNILNTACERKTTVKGIFIRFQYIVQSSVKTMDADYENIEGPKAQEMLRKSDEAVGYSYGSMTQQVFRIIVALAANVAGIILYSALIFELSPWIVVVLAVLGTANYLVVRGNLNWWERKRSKWMTINRKMAFLRNKACDFDAAKDVRLYKMMDWFTSISKKIMGETAYWQRQESLRKFGVDAAGAVIHALRDGIAYILLLVQMVRGGMGVTEFVYYFSLITQYSAWVFGMFTAFSELSRFNIQVSDLREFYDLPDATNRGPGINLPKSAPEIIFDGVSFRYPGSELDTLSDISFTIRPGEKVAIVGLNGAGKTTIVKLMCNFYRPSAGKITIDGRPLDDYNRDQLWEIYSVVFQDVHLMPMTIGENITLCRAEEVDRQRFNRVIELSDFADKLAALPQRENTLLVKQVFDNAVELSGGEKQRLALARALYKNGSIIILDEPTAALDPIAESRQYERYATLTEGCSSLYISHRLSSTKFCDRVLFLENGRIVEAGHHRQLMEQGGKYAALYAVQSQYYKEEAESA